jgi:hypothetical protein
MTPLDAGVRSPADLFHHLVSGLRSPEMPSIGAALPPDRAAGWLAEQAPFLDYVQAHERIWICLRLDMARN